MDHGKEITFGNVKVVYDIQDRSSNKNTKKEKNIIIQAIAGLRVVLYTCYDGIIVESFDHTDHSLHDPWIKNCN